MRIFCLATTLALAVAALPGCGDNNAPAPTTKPPSEPFEIDGAWAYLGPSDSPHVLTVTDSSMDYTALGGDWSSKWTITSYDNTLNHFQVTFGSGSGTYLPMGASLNGTYDLNGSVLTVQSGQAGSTYPPLQDAGTCTSATDGTAVPECRLYIKMQTN